MSNVQPTSVEAYDKVFAKLGNKQYEVFTILKEVEPACNKELAKKLCWPINEVTPRINELRYKGMVEEAFKAEYDGRKVLYWQTCSPEIKKVIKQNPEDWQPEAVSWLDDGEKI